MNASRVIWRLTLVAALLVGGYYFLTTPIRPPSDAFLIKAGATPDNLADPAWREVTKYVIYTIGVGWRVVAILVIGGLIAWAAKPRSTGPGMTTH